MKELILRFSRNFQLNPLIVAAIICQESAGDPVRWRFEKDWFKKHIEGKSRDRLGGTWLPQGICTETTERMGRAISWGAMQVLGQTARELGFTGNLTELLTPQNSIFYGCKKLRKCFDLHPDDEDKAIETYNGINPGYPKLIRGHMESGAAGLLLA